MENTTDISLIRERQLGFFNSGITRNPEYRRNALLKLREAIRLNEKEIASALKSDLNKSEFEAYATETGLVLAELRYFMANIMKWSRKKRVPTPLFVFPSRSFIQAEPYGRVLIMSPWNYPFQLPMMPLIGAVAAGNTVLIRLSGNAPATNKIIRKILAGCFSDEHVAAVECAVSEAEKILKLKWDMIFFTGSTEVGRKIYSEAAANLTPVVLELGGKSPVVVAADANTEVAARRIIWGKLINAGQTCIAPDYVFVHKSAEEKLIGDLRSEITKMYGNDPLANGDLPAIINQRAFERLKGLISVSQVVSGGRSNDAARTIEPTIVKAGPGAEIMKEEIFGPVLPVLTFTDPEEVISFINSREKPLALYVFSRNTRFFDLFLKRTSSGGILLNDVVIQFAQKYAAFGGVGESGLGRYHGYESFRSFSNMKAVMRSSTAIDIPLKYSPFGNKLKIIKWFLR